MYIGGDKSFTGTCDGIYFYRHMWWYWCEVLNFTIRFAIKSNRLVVIFYIVNPVRLDLTVWCFPYLVSVIHARKVFPSHSPQTREGKTYLAFMTMTLQEKHHTMRSSSQDCYNDFELYYLSHVICWLADTLLLNKGPLGHWMIPR